MRDRRILLAVVSAALSALCVFLTLMPRTVRSDPLQGVYDE